MYILIHWKMSMNETVLLPRNRNRRKKKVYIYIQRKTHQSFIGIVGDFFFSFLTSIFSFQASSRNYVFILQSETRPCKWRGNRARAGAPSAVGGLVFVQNGRRLAELWTQIHDHRLYSNSVPVPTSPPSSFHPQTSQPTERDLTLQISTGEETQPQQDGHLLKVAQEI